MNKLPEKVESYKKTPTFTEESIPAGLQKSHSTKAGTWGKICINKGKLLYTIENDPNESIELSPTKYGVVEPEVPHHVKPIGEVEFYVEFLKEI